MFESILNLLFEYGALSKEDYKNLSFDIYF